MVSSASAGWKSVWFVFLGLVLANACATFAQAAETITRYETLVELAVDGSLTITETIRVNAEGNQIKRGIFRDIPLQFKDKDGKLQNVDFDIISIKRDGQAEPYFTEGVSKFTRIYIGDKDVFLPHGAHSYEIKYWTDRQIRSFDNYDEIFWNATGNGWDFPIERAIATVILPAGASAENSIFYTGPQGARGKAAAARREDGGNRIVFETTAPLGPREGLTVGVKFAKGVIAPPSEAQKSRWFWQENGALILAFSALAIVFIYYLWAWSRVGRDPQKGVTVPRWKAPDGISPALTAYIHKKGFSGHGWDALSAAMINLAVKGFVTLEKEESDLSVNSTGKMNDGTLPVGEAALFKTFKARGSFAISENNSISVQALQSAFTGAIETEHRSEFYKANWAWIAFGVGLSILGFILTIGFSDIDEETLGIMFVTMLVCGGIMFAIAHIGRNFFSASGLVGKLQSVLMIGVFAAVAIPNALVHASTFVFDPREPLLLATMAGLFMVNVLFFFLLGAPTPIGRKMMDGIDGLKVYLELAEKDRMNLTGNPAMSPRHFEGLLPYAVALGVEKPWSDAFEVWLAAASVSETRNYNPHWQRGFHSGGRNIAQSFGSIGQSMGNSFTASMPVPESSSSGFSSGGSSGGGGGGGGGGGW